MFVGEECERRFRQHSKPQFAGNCAFVIPTEGGAPELAGLHRLGDAQSADDPGVEIGRGSAIPLYDFRPPRENQRARSVACQICSNLVGRPGRKARTGIKEEGRTSRCGNAHIPHRGLGCGGVLRDSIRGKGVDSPGGIRSTKVLDFIETTPEIQSCFMVTAACSSWCGTPRAASGFLEAEKHDLWRLAIPEAGA